MAKGSNDYYGEDLAFIHDSGYGGVAREAADCLIQTLTKGDLKEGLVVDLGCGSGVSSASMAQAGYEVLGVDFSSDMVALAQAKVPGGKFVVGSALDFDPPLCVAATLVGEVVNYLFDQRNTDAKLLKLFRRIHRSLAPGGVLLLDAAGPGRIPEGRRKAFMEGDGWVCLVDVEENPKTRLLTRRIISFRETTGGWRRSDEVHRQRLYRPAETSSLLRQAGFRVRRLDGYVPPFPPGVAGFVAQKAKAAAKRP